MFHGDYPITRWSDDWVAPITKQQFSKYNPIKHSIFSCSHCSCSIFLLVSYSLDTQVVLSLILIDVQYLQKAVSSFEKGLHCQNHSSSGSQHPVKKIPPPLSKISDSPSLGGYPTPTPYHYLENPVYISYIQVVIFLGGVGGW